MTGSLALAASLVAVLAAVAIVGPAMLTAARPHLDAHPRAAIAIVGALGLTWVAALAAVGVALAWAITGPALVPGAAGAVCQRCLVAASPFSSPPLAVGLPSAVLLSGSVLIAAAVAVSVLREVAVRTPRICRASRQSAVAGPVVWIAGVRVRIVEHPQAVAYALPRRCGGVTVSRGALDLLDAAELRAVVAHEAAHLSQRHHLVALLTAGVAAPLRWVPFIAACADTIRGLFEIAADADARRGAGTTALVSALVKLQEAAAAEAAADCTPSGASEARTAGVLFALGSGSRAGEAGRGALHDAGPSPRVRSLLSMGGRPRRWPTAGLTALVAPLTVTGAGVHAAGAVALLSGCAIG